MGYGTTNQGGPMATLRMRWATAATLTALIVCVCYGSSSVFAISPAIAASSIAGNWTVEPPATPVDAQHVVLQAVSCAEATACMAVGYSEESTPGAAPLAEMWNGSRWSLSGAVSATPGSNLLGVSCPVAGWCAAVGSNGQEGFAETWNGTVWTKYTIAAPSGSQSFTLLGVSCTSPTHCLAVGYYVDDTGYGKTLVEEWNGSTWTEGNAVDPNPRGAPYDATSELYAISCASPSSCVAVGEYEDEPDDTDPALAESWNGSTWTVDSTPTILHAFQTYLNSVSCWAPGSCTAVGGYDIFGNPPPEGNTVSESWDGSVWSLQSAPVLPETFSELHGVSCTSATFCIGLGYGSPGAHYTALWNGAWSYEPFGTGLESVSCASEMYCLAVGGEEAAVYVSNNENPLYPGGGISPPPPTPQPSPAPPPAPDVYAALGDSYSSGEGAPPFESSSDTSQNKCHRSLHAYAYDVKGKQGFPSTLQFSACSGAKIANFYPGKGQYTEKSGQLATLSSQDSIVSMTIGGNDVKFGPLIKSCVVLPACNLTDDLATRALIKHTLKRLPQLYSTILADAPNAQVYVLGYPHFFSAHPSLLCNGIDRFEAVWITRMEDLFNDGISNDIRQVASARLHYVDTSDAFSGGELCSGHKPVYMNGLIKAHLEYSFHPTRLGQERLAQRLEAAVHG